MLSVNGRRRAVKRAMDLAIVVTVPLVLAPIWLLIWLLIPLAIYLCDRGPIFYRQTRIGRGGKEFSVLKFRTMVPDADRIGPAWTTDGDRRVTCVGRVLRKTALDEMPQLLNILRGDMSFVGPKPLSIAEHEKIAAELPEFLERLMVLPGLTGLAQVYNRGDDTRKKLAYDLEYIQRMSLYLDIKLMILSVVNTLAGRWDTRSGKQS